MRCVSWSVQWPKSLLPERIGPPGSNNCFLNADAVQLSDDQDDFDSNQDNMACLYEETDSEAASETTSPATHDEHSTQTSEPVLDIADYVTLPLSRIPPGIVAKILRNYPNPGENLEFLQS